MSPTLSEMMNMNAMTSTESSLATAVAPTQLAESTYRSLRSAGLSDMDIMAFAGELLSLVAAGVRATPNAET